MILANRKVVRADNNSRTQRGMHHHLLVHLYLETEVRITVTIHTISSLDWSNLKIVWHKRVVGVPHVVNVVESSLANVVMARHVFSNSVKFVTL